MKNSKKQLLITGLIALFAFSACEQEVDSTQTQDEVTTEVAENSEFNQLIEEALAEQSSLGAKTLNTEVQTVDFVELDRYDGRWYEIAKFPNPFEQDCSCTTADYEIANGVVNVLNNCTLTSNGEFNSITGTAVVADAETNAKLVLTLNGIPFPANYWVIDLIAFDHEDSYDFSVVSGPDRQNLFILSRTPKINTFKQKFAVIKILINLIRQGYDITKLEGTAQFEDCVYP